MPDLLSGLSHINPYTEESMLNKVLEAIEYTSSTPGKDTRPALLMLNSCFKARTLKCLIDGDIRASRINAYIASCARILAIKVNPSVQAYSQGFDLLYPLLTDNTDLLH